MKILLLLVLVFLAGSAIYRILTIDRSVAATLAAERARMRVKDRVAFEETRLSPHDQDQVRIIQSTREVRDLIYFKDSFFAATSGGLVRLSPEGNMLRHFTVLDGLPESDLTCLTVFEGKLYIGTQTKGLVVFDGEKFTGFTFTDRNAQAITAFVVDGGTLVIGTFNGGMIEFDGRIFTEIKAEKERIAAINCLSKVGPRLYIGTFNNGIFEYADDIWTHFTTAEGLPSNRAVGIEAFEDQIYAATDFGLAVMENRRFRSVATIPVLSSMSIYDGQLLLAKDDGEIRKYPRETTEFSPKKGLEHARLIGVGNNLFLLSNGGILRVEGGRLTGFGEKDEHVSDNVIAALANDEDGNLWVGTFRHGIDVLSPEDAKLKHVESESVREINYLRSAGHEVSAATSSGLIHFAPDGSQSALTVNDGLPSNSVTHYSDDFVATAKGLAFREDGRLRVLSTVQGLPSNSVYTTLKTAEKVYVGTLSGLAEVKEGRVARTFKDSNSGLTTNWVTALCAANDRVFIGTYGGGVFELSPFGEIHSFEGETGKFTVNPNAMFTDGERLYAGTLTGLRILDLKTQAWTTVKNILPSETVMSITGNEQNIYFGTTAGIAKVEKNYFPVR